MTTAAELRELDDDELESRLVNARKELFNLRFQAATGRLDNSARLGALRREIARMLTVMRSRPDELESTASAAGRPKRGSPARSRLRTGRLSSARLPGARLPGARRQRRDEEE